MNFKETDLKVFKSHWKLKQDNILKSEIFDCNINSGFLSLIKNNKNLTNIISKFLIFITLGNKVNIFTIYFYKFYKLFYFCTMSSN